MEKVEPIEEFQVHRIHIEPKSKISCTKNQIQWLYLISGRLTIKYSMNGYDGKYELPQYPRPDHWDSENIDVSQELRQEDFFRPEDYESYIQLFSPEDYKSYIQGLKGFQFKVPILGYLADLKPVKDLDLSLSSEGTHAHAIVIKAGIGDINAVYDVQTISTNDQVVINNDEKKTIIPLSDGNALLVTKITKNENN